jgi:glyoxylase-like metal-dependent hydrolase (beta-lactamase superfamily II)
MTLLHTPGHTPDELALYDTAEKMLYVGDSLYEYEDIIFPNEGSIVQWFTSIDYLINFVNDENQNNRSVTGNVLINSGHCTVTQPALETLERARAFMEQVVDGTEEVKERLVVRGEENVVYRQKAGNFSLRCPERLVEDARQMALT